MADVRGRRWPASLPFTTVRSGEGILQRDGFTAEVRPGDFQFQDIGGKPTDDPLAAQTEYERDGGKPRCRLAFACPRTGKPCAGGLGLLIGRPDNPASHPSWHWDGNVETPTLSPSINCIGGCGWHGFLQAGVFRD